MKRFFLAALLLMTSLSYAQLGTTTQIRRGSTLPTTCVGGDIFMKSGSSAGFYYNVAAGSCSWVGPAAVAGLGDPGSNGIVKRTATNTTGVAAAADVVALFSTCSGTQYLGADGSCHSATAAGLADPGSNGIVKRTALNTTAAATSTDILGLWTGTCSSSTYLRGDGSCAAASGGTAGNSVLNGSGAPSSGTGSNGDFYIDTAANCIYGPKASGVWPGTCVSLVGPSWYGATLTPLVTSDWSNIGSGCSVTNTTGPGGGAAIQVVGTSGTQNNCGIKHAASGTFSYVFAFYGILSGDSNNNLQVGFTDGTKTESCIWGSGISSSLVASWGSYKASALTSASISGANGSVIHQSYANPTGPNFVRLRATSGTNLACDISADGVNWVNSFTDTTPYLTPSAVIFTAEPRGASGATEVGVLVSFN